METLDPNVYPTILGGVSRGFWTPFLDRGAQSAIFWHVKTGTFGVFTCQKMALRVFRDTLGDRGDQGGAGGTRGGLGLGSGRTR